MDIARAEALYHDAAWMEFLGRKHQDLTTLLAAATLFLSAVTTFRMEATDLVKPLATLRLVCHGPPVLASLTIATAIVELIAARAELARVAKKPDNATVAHSPLP